MRTGNTDSKSSSENSLRAVARKWGAEIYPLDVKKINPMESVRLKCLVPLCEFYDACKICPPNIPGVAEFREKIINIEDYHTDYSAELKLAETVSALELAAFQQGNYLAMGLCVGGCKLCPQCAPPGEPCRHPFKARPSPEGFGIDITGLAREAGVPLEWPPKEYVNFLGLLLF
jgi:predicted metal-binding protein